MRVLLDTAALLFSAGQPDRLSKKAASTILNPANRIEVSAISFSEIAIKSARGKLHFSVDDIEQAMEALDARALAFTADHAYRLFQLPLHHFDPFDRQIIAQAMSENIPIVSPDRDFAFYQGLQVIW